MAFLKRCISTVIKCACGKPSIKCIDGSWYCLDCSEKELQKDKK